MRRVASWHRNSGIWAWSRPRIPDGRLPILKDRQAYVGTGRIGGVAMTESDIAENDNRRLRKPRRIKGTRFDADSRFTGASWLSDRPVLWHPPTNAPMVTAVELWPNAPDLRCGYWIRAVRKAVGPVFPIGLRISQWKLQDFTAKLATTPQEMEAWLVPWRGRGIDSLPLFRSAGSGTRVHRLLI